MKSNFLKLIQDFLFVNVGYNLRSTDMNASIGLVQLKKLEKFNNKRHEIGKTWNKAFSHLKKERINTAYGNHKGYKSIMVWISSYL